MESKFTDDHRAKIREEILAEIAATTPTAKHRVAARRVLREMELEALTAVRAASDTLETEEEQYKTNRRVRQTLYFSVLLTIVPVLSRYLYFCVAHGWGGAQSTPFLAAAIPYFLALVVSYVTKENAREVAQNRMAECREALAAYRTNASRCREAWRVQVSNAATRGELSQIVSSLAIDKCYQPKTVTLSSRALQKARIEVREYIATDIDTERYLHDETVEELTEPQEDTQATEDLRQTTR